MGFSGRENPRNDVSAGAIRPLRMSSISMNQPELIPTNTMTSGLLSDKSAKATRDF